MRSTLTGIILFTFLLTVFIPNHAHTETIQGEYCYTYGDKESLMEAKQLTRTLAIRNAIESYRAYINSTSQVNNFTLTNDIVQMISSGYMKDIAVVSHSVDGRKVCEKIQATVSPQAIEKAIKREVLKRTEKVEEQGIDNNGVIKILNIRSLVKSDGGSSYACVEVIVKVLRNLNDVKNEDTKWIFIYYYDKDGNAIGGDKRRVDYSLTDEITTQSFGSYLSNIPIGTSYYKVWLKKSAQTSNPKQSSSKKTKSKRKLPKLEFEPDKKAPEWKDVGPI